MKQRLKGKNETVTNCHALKSKILDSINYNTNIVDIVEILNDSKNLRHYWNVLKIRLKYDWNEKVTNCHQLKFEVNDGKYRINI